MYCLTFWMKAQFHHSQNLLLYILHHLFIYYLHCHTGIQGLILALRLRWIHGNVRRLVCVWIYLGLTLMKGAKQPHPGTLAVKSWKQMPGLHRNLLRQKPWRRPKMAPKCKEYHEDCSPAIGFLTVRRLFDMCSIPDALNRRLDG